MHSGLPIPKLSRQMGVSLLGLSLMISLAALGGCAGKKSDADKSLPVKIATEPAKEAESSRNPAFSLPDFTLQSHGRHKIRIYNEPIPVEHVDYDEWDVDLPETAYFGIYTAMQRLDTDWILEAYAPSDRRMAKSLIADDYLMLSRAREGQNIAEERILERIEYQDFAILKIERSLKDGRHLHTHVVLKDTPEGWLLSESLKGDALYGGLTREKADLPLLEVPESKAPSGIQEL